jgi:hypothetical protein
MKVDTMIRAYAAAIDIAPVHVSFELKFVERQWLARLTAEEVGATLASSASNPDDAAAALYADVKKMIARRLEWLQELMSTMGE